MRRGFCLIGLGVRLVGDGRRRRSRDARRRKRRTKRQIWADTGRCMHCGGERSLTASGRPRVRCQRCYDQHQAAINRRRRLNLCLDCEAQVGDPWEGYGPVRCAVCLAKYKRMYLAYATRRKMAEQPRKCPDCTGLAAPRRKRCPECQARIVAHRAAEARAKTPSSVRYHAMKDEIYAAYGNRCVGCGQSDRMFLCIDHVLNDAYLDVKKDGKTRISGSSLYKKIRDLGFPDRYQILCHNCNRAKHVNGGVLPWTPKTSSPERQTHSET